jgi:rhodanese-related sulfurtransferase
MNSITTTDLAALGSDITLVDVRETDEFAAARVDGAINIPLSQLQARVDDVPTDTTVYVMCLSGGRSAQATAWLEQRGHDVVNVLGGISQWDLDGLPVVRGA